MAVWIVRGLLDALAVLLLGLMGVLNSLGFF